MCGRFAQVIKHDQLQKMEKELRLTHLAEQEELNFNVAPTQTVMAVLSQDAGRYPGYFRWGLIPSWSRELPKFNLINARADTITSKPSFRSGLQRGAASFRPMVSMNGALSTSSLSSSTP